ncbi:MAG: hypothetical protein KGJ45_11545 [Elusimicrobia bacterium]|nr:hypothetical protein [Elusimicrobiota bacterium]
MGTLTELIRAQNTAIFVLRLAGVLAPGEAPPALLQRFTVSAACRVARDRGLEALVNELVRLGSEGKVEAKVSL